MKTFRSFITKGSTSSRLWYYIRYWCFKTPKNL